MTRCPHQLRHLWPLVSILWMVLADALRFLQLCLRPSAELAAENLFLRKQLARDNYLMLSVLAEMRFNGVRVVSVADGLDIEEEEATLGIQIRGIFNELQLRDLKKKTLRGQIGQKERGFFVGERTFGYKSIPVGTVRMDKKGRPRPEGYKMVIEPREAATVLRIFQEFADGHSQSSIVRRLNAEGIPGQVRSTKEWSPATVHRILQNKRNGSCMKMRLSGSCRKHSGNGCRTIGEPAIPLQAGRGGGEQTLCRLARDYSAQADRVRS